MIQVRTTRVGDVNATGFTGIAVKEGNTEIVQVNLRSGGMHIMSTKSSACLIVHNSFSSSARILLPNFDFKSTISA